MAGPDGSLHQRRRASCVIWRPCQGAMSQGHRTLVSYQRRVTLTLYGKEERAPPGASVFAALRHDMSRHPSRKRLSDSHIFVGFRKQLFRLTFMQDYPSGLAGRHVDTPLMPRPKVSAGLPSSLRFDATRAPTPPHCCARATQQGGEVRLVCHDKKCEYDSRKRGGQVQVKL